MWIAMTWREATGGHLDARFAPVGDDAPSSRAALSSKPSNGTIDDWNPAGQGTSPALTVGDAG